MKKDVKKKADSKKKVAEENSQEIIQNSGEDEEDDIGTGEGIIDIQQEENKPDFGQDPDHEDASGNEDDGNLYQ